LRNDRIEAPCLFDGPINGERFHAYVEQFLVPTDPGALNGAKIRFRGRWFCGVCRGSFSDKEHTTMPNAKFFVDPTLSSAAGPYYNLFPVEPTRSDASSDWLTPNGKLVFQKTQNLGEWLAAIAKEAQPGGDVVLVGHGNRTGLHLFIGDKAQDVHLELEAADAIRRNQEGNQSDEDTAKILKMGADAYNRLKGQIEKVQALGLDRVDARACNIGQDAVAMSAMQQFFNCNTFCSPKILDSFGVIMYGSFVTDPAAFDKWVSKHAGAEVAGSSPNRFGFFQNLSKGVASESIAESAKGAKDWADSKMPPGGNFTGKNQLFYHALTDLKKFVFAGESEFRNQLVEATKGNVPLRRVDINAPLTR
jgi:hypothetical protein